jgi:hypothetical protein
MNDKMIGVDLAKSVFQRHAASMTGQMKLRKKLPRSQRRPSSRSLKQPSPGIATQTHGSVTSSSASPITRSTGSMRSS